jgi:hypothetical protein
VSRSGWLEDVNKTKNDMAYVLFFIPAMPYDESDKVGTLGTFSTPSIFAIIHVLICHLKW